MIIRQYSTANGICPSPSGEARWGLKTIRLSNSLSLPMGKVRIGYHTGEVRWGLMTIFRLVSIALELSLNFISFVVYPCLSWFLSKYSVLALCPQPSAWTQIKKMKH